MQEPHKFVFVGHYIICMNWFSPTHCVKCDFMKQLKCEIFF